MEANLVDGEELVPSSLELLWRNAHPGFVDGDIISSQVFRLSKSDQGKLSTARSSKVGSAEHFDEYTGYLGLPSAGVWAVSRAEVDAKGVRVIDDSAVQDGSQRPTGHAYLDLRAKSNNAAKTLGSHLRSLAQGRGRIHP